MTRQSVTSPTSSPIPVPGIAAIHQIVLNRVSLRTKSFRTPTSRRRLVWRCKKAQKEDRFLRGGQIACMIYDYFWVTGAHDTVLDCADLFTITLRTDDVQEFDTKWDENLQSMSKIPTDDV